MNGFQRWQQWWNELQRRARQRRYALARRRPLRGIEHFEERRVLAAVTPLPLQNIAAAGLGSEIDGPLGLDEQAGKSVKSAGDVNGDGYDDVIIGAPTAAPAGAHYAGRAYVVFGSASGIAANLSLGALVGTNGFAINGAVAADSAGESVAGAGDVNGDGFHDLIVGAPGSNANDGLAYVIFGKRTFAPGLNLSSLGAGGFAIAGVAAAGDRLGQAVSGAGDVNGDGFDDVLVGEPESTNGSAYVIFGAAANANVNVGALGARGFAIHGSGTLEKVGLAVSGAGDFNGDGFDDVVVGAPYSDVGAANEAGTAHVVFGKSSTTAVDLGVAGATHITISGDTNNSSKYAGTSVAAGDFNGDGLSDVLLGGSKYSTAVDDDLGAAYVVFGTTTPADLSVNAASVWKITGAAAGDYAGASVGAGDVNGDGMDDLIIGAPAPSAPSQGTAYVVFGKSGAPANLSLASLDGDNGFAMLADPVNGDAAGRAVAAAGDVNGDGFLDLLVGDPEANGNDGVAYLVRGANFTDVVDPLGDANSNTLTGAAGKSVNGANGNDRLTGGGGATSVILGGRGADVLAINDATFRRIVGGRGVDTLQVNGDFDLDFVADSTLADRVQSVERIDLRGAAANVLTITEADIIRISDSRGDLASDRAALLYVRASSDDTVNKAGFTQQGIITYQGLKWAKWVSASGNAILYQTSELPAAGPNSLLAEDLTDGLADGFINRGGTQTVSAGRYIFNRTNDGSPSVRTVALNLPANYSVKALMKGTGTFGATPLLSNAFIVFDFKSIHDFKVAGILPKSDLLFIGQYSAAGMTILASTTEVIDLNQDVDLELRVQGAQATVFVSGVQKLTQAVGAPTGAVGLGSLDSRASFDNFIVSQLT